MEQPVPPHYKPTKDRPRLAAIEIIKYIGPGLLVTVGFIDPGNWAANLSAGSSIGYGLLWVIALGTILLVILQHNAAHLGIATGCCISEAATIYLPRALSLPILGSAVAAAISTALAEVLGAAIAVQMLTGLSVRIGIPLAAAFVLFMILSNSYRRLERWIIGFVSLIGIGFIYEIALVHVDWPAALRGTLVPAIPKGGLLLVMSLLGSVVMPHNLFLHSEIIQSRQWNLGDGAQVRNRLRFEFLDTLFSMGVGWAINSAIIILAASTFFVHGQRVDQLSDAERLLEPLLGGGSKLIFAVALLLAGLASSITAGMAGGAIFTGIFGECYDPQDRHTRIGIVITLVGASVVAMLAPDPFQALVLSQMALSVQLPFTIFTQIALTSSKRVMGAYVNKPSTTLILVLSGVLVSAMNLALLASLIVPGFSP
ncbi:MAG TPA: Nramp family divalent metal transporter [Rectinemataceae bacterium]|nr:Nramp family divalent metal transporter [Rectinemataceae bacterium]